MIGISVNFKDFSYLAVHQSPGSLMVLICYGSVLEMHDPPPHNYLCLHIVLLIIILCQI